VNHTGANPQTNTVAIIPARFASSRLPGKPLLEIAGKPMICWVVERALAASRVSRVVVATDDARVIQAVSAAGYEGVMTRGDHASGTDRLAEVVATLGEFDIVVNVQGDEPLISPETIDRAVDALIADNTCALATTWEPITDTNDVLSPDVVKVVMDNDGYAIYFSRAPVPYPRDAIRRYGSIESALAKEPGLASRYRKHTGLYVYRRDFLLEFARWPQSPLEQAESLEQLRALERGIKIIAVKASAPSIGVDTLEDLERVRKIVLSEPPAIAGENFLATSQTRTKDQSPATAGGDRA
jgi:3-deoxy-manno-octulosonate cytidylyltransferase (CMP-KDO synthetase)